MRIDLRSSVAGLMIFVAGSALAVELSEVPRSLVREPVYRQTPKYALIVVGSRAEQRFWLVLDGDNLYVDRNGDGDLTPLNERVTAPQIIKVGNPGFFSHFAHYEIGELGGHRFSLDHWVQDPKYDLQSEKPDTPPAIRERHQLLRERHWEVATLTRHIKDGGVQNPQTLVTDPATAQITWLGGPLTMRARMSSSAKLERGQTSLLDVRIVTPSQAPPGVPVSAGMCAPVHTDEVPANVHPVAEIEFPAETAGGPKEKLRVTLDRRCCGDSFHALVKIPASAPLGTARVTVTFDDWLLGGVSPGEFEISIVDARPDSQN